MQKLVGLFYTVHGGLFGKLKYLDGVALLALRLYLVPVFWMAGTNKLSGFDGVVEWFGNGDWGLGLPFPTLMAYLATYTEVIGAILLLLGLATRWIAVPLMVTMIVAMVSVHGENGWAAIADSASEDVAVRLDRARSILQEHSNYSWLTEKGNIVILNNGIEFAATYFVMLLTLFFYGGGRYLSLDHWLDRFLKPKDRN